MKKQRHIKTPIEKYGFGDITNQILIFLKENRKLDNMELFNRIPYIGILYIPESLQHYTGLKFFGPENFEKCSDFFDNTLVYNDVYGLMKKTKIARINVNHTTCYVFDSHHYSIGSCEFRTNDEFVLEGNILVPNCKNTRETKQWAIEHEYAHYNSKTT